MSPRFREPFPILYADDVDAAAGELRAAGFDEVRPPTDEPWGERMAYLRDPDGHLIEVGQTTATEMLPE